MTKLNPRLAKIHRVYTIDQAARLFGVSRNTVRAWNKAGLPIISGRPILIEGRELRAFHERRRARGKRPCPPGTLYCCKCREPRIPLPKSLVFEAGRSASGNLRGVCATCETRMFRRARQERLAAIMPNSPVLIVMAQGHIEACPSASANRA